ncbi:hypothetical protein OIO90_000724 [Microbotryomycetes sp. JL221]|nr:hypothetical protein OIO90_000724 [Microbotryomycetes sp. JL221]
MRHTYRPPTRSGGRRESLMPPTQTYHRLHVTHDEEPGSEDDDTAVATDLSALPPPPAQINRAGFRDNPVSDQVIFDKHEAPATVAPPRPAAMNGRSDSTNGVPRSTSLPVTTSHYGEALNVLQPKAHVATRSMSASPTPVSASRPRQPYLRRQLSRPVIVDDELDRDSDNDTIVPDSDPGPPPSRRAFQPPTINIRRPSVAPRPPVAPSFPPPPPLTRPPYRRVNREELDPGFAVQDDEEDAVSAVGTGVATDLSLEEIESQQPRQVMFAGSRHQLRPVVHVEDGPEGSHGRSINNRAMASSYRPPSPLENLGSLRQQLPFGSYQQQSELSHRSKLYEPVHVPRRTRSLERNGGQPEQPHGGPLQTPSPSVSRPSPRPSVISARSMQDDQSTSEVSISSLSSASSSSTLTLTTSSHPPAQESKLERELIALLNEMNFSVALKDLHDQFNLEVQKTLVTEDGHGHAYVKVHCRRIPRESDFNKEPHFKKHWVSLGGTRSEFRTESHRITVVWKTTGVAEFEAAAASARR